MAVGIGHIVDGRQTYVAGAPRKVRNFGQVLLYVQGSQKLELQFAFDGEQIASGFGYDLTVGDFNGDGYVRSSVFPETVLYSTLLHTTTAVAMVAFYLRLSVCLSVCFAHDISKTDTAMSTNLDRDEFWKPIYFGVKMSKVKVTSHKNIAGADLCTLVSAGCF